MIMRSVASSEGRKAAGAYESSRDCQTVIPDDRTAGHPHGRWLPCAEQVRDSMGLRPGEPCANIVPRTTRSSIHSIVRPRAVLLYDPRNHIAQGETNGRYASQRDHPRA